MTADELRKLQAPFKEKYKADPPSAKQVLRAQGTLDAERLTCRVRTGASVTEAGLPPDGVIKTRIAFEQLISRGIGDTIRV